MKIIRTTVDIAVKDSFGDNNEDIQEKIKLWIESLEKDKVYEVVVKDTKLQYDNGQEPVKIELPHTKVPNITDNPYPELPRIYYSEKTVPDTYAIELTHQK